MIFTAVDWLSLLYAAILGVHPPSAMRAQLAGVGSILVQAVSPLDVSYSATFANWL